MNDEIIYIMTPEDLTKALKCLSGEEEIFCKDCAFSHYDHYGVFACKKNAAKAALYFLNRHRAEIERKDRIIESYALQYGTVTDKEVFLRKARVEAIKEFAERLQAEATLQHGGVTVVYGSCIDNIVKEMKERNHET